MNWFGLGFGMLEPAGLTRIDLRRVGVELINLWLLFRLGDKF